MLTRERIRDDINRRARITLPYLAIALVAVFIYLPLVKVLFNPPPASSQAILLILPVFAVLLVPVLVGLRIANQIRTLCPECGKSLNGKLVRLLRTRSCPECGSQIIQGKIVTDEVRARHRRLIERAQFRFTKYWVWAWPLSSGIVIATDLVLPGSLSGCEQVLWLPALIGVVSSGWMFLRAKSWSSLFPLGISAVLCVIGVWLDFGSLEFL